MKKHDALMYGFVAAVQVTQLLHYWMRLSNENPGGEEKTAAAFLQVLHQRNALKSDEVRGDSREAV